MLEVEDFFYFVSGTIAQLLTPYSNPIRLGQGFDSYTQQICLDQAVLPDTKVN